MHDYLLSTEWVRFAFVLGIAVSMVLYERRHLTTGSIVVPGYIAVFLLHPMVLIATFVNALATYGLVNKVLRRYVLLYGRTKFTVLASVSTLIQTGLLAITPSGPWLWERDIAMFVGVGYIVPALIAHDMARQGISKTIKSVVLAGVLVAIPIAFALLMNLPGVNDLSPVDGYGQLAFPVAWLPVAVLVSIGASWAVSHNYQCRSGGFIGAALIGMFLADIWQIIAAVSIAAISYLIVSKLLMDRMILFGRRKFSAMLLTASAIAWPTLWIGDRVLGSAHLEHVGVGSLALTPLLLPGLIANDLQRTSPGRVFLGVVLAGTCTVTTTWWVGATVTRQHLEFPWKVLAVATLGILLAPQLVSQSRAGALAIATAFRNARGRDRARPATMPTRVPTFGLPGFGWALAAPVPVIALTDDRSETRPARPTRIDWSASWAEWANAHPNEARDAQHWLEHRLHKTCSAPTRSGPAPSAPAPSAPARVDAEPTNDHRRERYAAIDINRTVQSLRTRLLASHPAIQQRRIGSLTTAAEPEPLTPASNPMMSSTPMTTDIGDLPRRSRTTVPMDRTLVEMAAAR